MKGGETEKRVGETKILKRGEQAGSRAGCLKKRGPGMALQTMVPNKYPRSKSHLCKEAMY